MSPNAKLTRSFQLKTMNRMAFWRDHYEELPAPLVIVTDIALTAVTGADGLRVSARSLKSAEPLVGVKLTLLATGQDQLGWPRRKGKPHLFGPGFLRRCSRDWPLARTRRFRSTGPQSRCIDLSDRGICSRRALVPFRSVRLYGARRLRTGETVQVMALLRDRIGDV